MTDNFKAKCNDLGFNIIQNVGYYKIYDRQDKLIKNCRGKTKLLQYVYRNHRIIKTKGTNNNE